MAHQMTAFYAGAIFGSMCLVGAVILWIRRFFNPRVSTASRPSDKFIPS